MSAELLVVENNTYTIKSNQESKYDFGQLLVHIERKCIGVSTGDSSEKNFSVVSDGCSQVTNSQFPENWLAVDRLDQKPIVADEPVLSNVYYQSARRQVVDYWKTLMVTDDNDLLHKYLRKSLTDGLCWYDYLQKLSFSLYIDKVQRHRDIFLIVPENDSMYQTNLHRYDYSQNSYCITFDTRTDFLAIGFSNMLMIDFDFEGDYEQNREAAADKLLQLTSHLGFGWALFHTDHGLHAFLVTHVVDYKQLKWFHLMLSIEADPWYAAFATVFGWNIRLNAKQARPDDFVAEPRGGYTSAKLKLGETPELYDFDEKKVLLLPTPETKVNPMLMNQVRFHSYLTQLYRKKQGKQLDPLKCAIADQSIQSQVVTSYRNQYLTDTRKQIRSLWSVCNLQQY